MTNLHYKLPDQVSGYQLDPNAGWFSILQPSAATNLVTNPSFELTDFPYTAVGGGTTKSVVSTHQRRGVYSLKVTPGFPIDSGVQLSITLLANTAYCVSMDILGVSGRKYNILVYDPVATPIAKKDFTASGAWQRVNLTFGAISAGSYKINLLQTIISSDPFYTDGWQVEATRFPTSYFDGDSVGFIAGQTAYYWNGTPHASSSVRIADTGSGGREMKLIDIGLKLLAVAGLGMASFMNSSTPFSNGGAYYQRSIQQPRQFMLAGQLDFTNLSDLQRARKKLIDLVNPLRLPSPQPLIVRYHRTDPCTGEETETLDIPCVYESGLEGSIDNLYSQRLGLVFRQFMPTIYADGNQGAILTSSETINNAAYILYRDPSGEWLSLDTGLNNPTQDLAYAYGKLYVCGAFTTAGGVAANRIAQWDGSAWSALGTGMDNQINALAIGPDGTLYAGGNFSLAGGGAASYIAQWDGSAWSALGTGMDAAVYSLAVGLDGSLYAGGIFTTAGGVAANRIAKWDGSAWSALDTGMDALVRDLAVGQDGSLYAGGVFTTAGGVAANRIAKWNGTAWSALEDGFADGVVFQIIIAADGNLYAGGSFTTSGSITVNRIAKWNGISWSALDSGLNNDVYTITSDRGGKVYVGGNFTASNGGVLLPDRGAIWNGTSWIPIPVSLDDTVPALITINAMITTENNGLYISGSFNGPTAISPKINTITISGNDNSFPWFEFTGPGTLRALENSKSGDKIYFNNLLLMTGETLKINTDPLNFSVISSFRGNLVNNILPGSSSTLRLQPGSNIVSVFITGTTVASSAKIYWRAAYSGLDGAVP